MLDNSPAAAFAAEITPAPTNSFRWVSRAGCLYWVGNMLEAGLGLAQGFSTGDWSKAESAALFIPSSLMFWKKPGDNRWFGAACAVNCAALTVAVYPALHNPVVLGGWATFVASQAMGIASPKLTEMFGDAANAVTRLTAGRPRTVMAVLSFTSRAPLFYDAMERALSHGGAANIAWAGMNAVWAAADFCMALSKPKVPLKQARQSLIS